MSTDNTSTADNADREPVAGAEAHLRALTAAARDGLFADNKLLETIADFKAAGTPAISELKRLAITRGLYVENPRRTGDEGGLAGALVFIIKAPEPRP
ncbi:hypothetical protein SEUCBS140593_010008 [Sporothrix eucalyptigena]|uniref:Uncharacterized protein n=1 Tax=Sporothrix eucalyptigena TaxID=1812306 RepID=A0ABP0D1A2_9PEZI